MAWCAMALAAGRREGRIDIFTGTLLLAELVDILGRRKFAAKIAAANIGIDQLVDGYAALAVVVRPAQIPRTAPDPDDDMVLATALAAKADLVVTGDHALLSLRQHNDVRIVSVSEALQALETRSL